jgi:hypothetical protein
MEEQRKSGTMAKGGRPSKKTTVKNTVVSLKSQGIDENLAKAARKAAAMSCP